MHRLASLNNPEITSTIVSIHSRTHVNCRSQHLIPGLRIVYYTGIPTLIGIAIPFNSALAHFISDESQTVIEDRWAFSGLWHDTCDPNDSLSHYFRDVWL